MTFLGPSSGHHLKIPSSDRKTHTHFFVALYLGILHNDFLLEFHQEIIHEYQQSNFFTSCRPCGVDHGHVVLDVSHSTSSDVQNEAKA